MGKDVDFRRLSQKELASALGLTDRTIRNLQADRTFPRNKDKSYDLPQVIAWLLNQNAPGEGEKWLTEFRRQRALITTLEREQREGSLIDRDQAIKWLGHLVHEAKAAFLAIPRRLTPVLIGKSNPREIEELLRGEIYAALEKLSKNPRGSK
jgi:hypothetical protein